MRYSNQLSIVVALLLVAICFAPWVYIDPIQTTITGWDAGKTNLGKPGLMNILFASTTIIMILLPGIWAKRVNVFICSFNFSNVSLHFLSISPSKRPAPLSKDKII